MWKPKYEKKQGILSRWLERRRRVRNDMEDSQFHWKQIHFIRQSQSPLGPESRSKENIPKEAKTVYAKELAVEIRILCSEKNAQASAWIYAARRDDCIVDVASGMVKSGNQYETRKGRMYYYIDSIFIDGRWLSPVRVCRCPGGVSRIMFDTHGYNRVFVRLSFDTGQWIVDMVGAPKW